MRPTICQAWLVCLTFTNLCSQKHLNPVSQMRKLRLMDRHTGSGTGQM